MYIKKVRGKGLKRKGKREMQQEEIGEAIHAAIVGCFFVEKWA